jgi:transcriptional regulator with XRE-family HTH domain
MTFTRTIDLAPDVYEVNDHILTATQCKMARAALGPLGWDMHDLAKSSGVSVNIIADFEHGRSMPIPATLVALRQALEAHQCLRFTKDGGCDWPVLFDVRGPLLTRNQCRVARGLLGWDINDLAKQARVVSVNTIERLENGESRPIRATQKALRQAFEDAGVHFTEELSAGGLKRLGVTPARTRA